MWVDDRQFPALGEELPSFVSREGLPTCVSTKPFSPPRLLSGPKLVGDCDCLVLIF